MTRGSLGGSEVRLGRAWGPRRVIGSGVGAEEEEARREKQEEARWYFELFTAIVGQGRV